MSSKGMLMGLAVSILFHAMLLLAWSAFPASPGQKQYQEIIVDLNPDPPPQILEEEEQEDPLEDPEEVPPQPEEESSEDLEAEVEVPDLPEPDSLVAANAPASTPDPPSQSSASAQLSTQTNPPPISRQPSEEELLGDLEGIPTPPQTQGRNTASDPDGTDLSQFVPQELDQDHVQEAARIREIIAQTRYTESLGPGQETSRNSQPQNPNPGQEALLIQEELVRLREEMAQDFTQNPSTDPGPGVNSTGPTDSRIEGQVGRVGRGLVSPERLNLQPFLEGVRNPAWPVELSVTFEVNPAGFVRILNEADFSAYNDLSLAVYALFRGQVFVPTRGTLRQEGSITFQLQ